MYHSLSGKHIRLEWFQNSDNCEGYDTFYNDSGVVVAIKQVAIQDELFIVTEALSFTNGIHTNETIHIPLTSISENVSLQSQATSQHTLLFYHLRLF